MFFFFFLVLIDSFFHQVFSMFQTNRENGLIKQNVAPKQFGQGVKRAPLGNIGNKVVKKMAVEKVRSSRKQQQHNSTPQKTTNKYNTASFL